VGSARRLVVLVACVAAFTGAGGARAADVTPYGGLATWIDIWDLKAWRNPEATMSAAAQRGIRTVFIETSNYSRTVDVFNPLQLAGLLDAAHRYGMKAVSWYLPSFLHPAVDLRRSLAAIRFRTPSGVTFDSFGLDIEADVVRSASLRSRRLVTLSQQIRAAVGGDYTLGAITPSPLGMSLHPKYWPRFPFEQLRAVYDVFVPMGYYSYHGRGAAAARREVVAAVRIIRNATADPAVPIHVIGGLAAATTRAEARAWAQAIADCGVLGYSLYDYLTTTPLAWSVLTQPLPVATRGC
jgi:hypothetical protein